MKCTNCREKDIELITRWERFKNWLFHRMFSEDILDLSQNKYTQGMSDGLTKGKEWQREAMKIHLKRMYNIDI